MRRLHKHRTAVTQVKGLELNRRHFVLNKHVSLRGTVPRHTARWETHSRPCGNDLLLPMWSSSGKHSLSRSGGSEIIFWSGNQQTWFRFFPFLPGIARHVLSKTPWGRVLPELLTVPQLVNRTSLFVKPEVSLSHSQQLATCPCPEPEQTRTSKWSPSLRYPTKIPFALLLCSIRATCHTYLIILDVITPPLPPKNLVCNADHESPLYVVFSRHLSPRPT